ncbi:hypothetical protein ACLOJK_000289 [Asimina triloba]
MLSLSLELYFSTWSSTTSGEEEEEGRRPTISSSNLELNAMADSPISSSSICHLVVIPYPGFGHIKPLIYLSHHLSSLLPHILISFVVTDEWSRLIASDPKPPNLHIRTIPNVIPSEKVRALDFPGFLEAVSTKMAEPVERLLDQLPHPISCIVADTYLSWAVDIGNRRKIPVASVFTMSPAVFSIFYHYHLIQSDPKWLKEADDDCSSGTAELRHLDFEDELSFCLFAFLTHPHPPAKDVC